MACPFVPSNGTQSAPQQTNSTQGDQVSNKFSVLSESDAHGIVTIDSNGIICSVNKHICVSFGYEVTELIGSNVKILIPPPYLEQHDTYLMNYQRTKQKQVIGIPRVLEGRHKAGQIFPIRLVVSEIDSGDGSKMFCGIIDKVRFDWGISYLDVDGTIREADKRFVSLFGFSSSSDIVGLNINHLVKGSNASTGIKSKDKNGSSRKNNSVEFPDTPTNNGNALPATSSLSSESPTSPAASHQPKKKKLENSQSGSISAPTVSVAPTANPSISGNSTVSPSPGKPGTSSANSSSKAGPFAFELFNLHEDSLNDIIRNATGFTKDGRSFSILVNVLQIGTPEKPTYRLAARMPGKSSEAMFTVTSNGLILSCNHILALEMMGYRDYELVGKTISKFLVGFEGDAVLILNDWSRSKRHLAAKHKDGSEFEVSVEVFPLNNHASLPNIPLYSMRIRRSVTEDHTNDRSSDLEIAGGLLANEFAAVKMLGTGSSGSIFECRPLLENSLPGISPGRNVAVKVLRKKAFDEMELRRIRNEMKIMEKLDHPHIVKWLGTREDDQFVCIFMELCSGGELLKYVRGYPQGLSEKEAHRLFLQLAEAVSYCHSHNIIHRDLKHRNILLDSNMNVRLVDFGLANSYTGKHMETFCGTPAYAAPEVITSQPYNGPAVDVWSLGVVLYSMVFATFPFVSINNITQGNWVRPAEGTCSSELVDLFGKIFIVNALQRITLTEIINHVWMTDINTLDNLKSAGVSSVSDAQLSSSSTKTVSALGYTNTFENFTGTHSSSEPSQTLPKGKGSDTDKDEQRDRAGDVGVRQGDREKLMELLPALDGARETSPELDMFLLNSTLKSMRKIAKAVEEHPSVKADRSADSIGLPPKVVSNSSLSLLANSDHSSASAGLARCPVGGHTVSNGAKCPLSVGRSSPVVGTTSSSPESSNSNVGRTVAPAAPVVGTEKGRRPLRKVSSSSSSNATLAPPGDAAISSAPAASTSSRKSHRGERSSPANEDTPAKAVRPKSFSTGDMREDSSLRRSKRIKST